MKAVQRQARWFAAVRKATRCRVETIARKWDGGRWSRERKVGRSYGGGEVRGNGEATVSLHFSLQAHTAEWPW